MRDDPRAAAAFGKRVRSAALAALALRVLLLVQCRGENRVFFEMLGASFLVTSLNLWLNAVVAPRTSMETLEGVRTVANTVFTAFAGFATHWSFPMWMFVPYMAVVADEFDSKGGRRALIHAGVVSGLALADGVPLVYPASFGTLALGCYWIVSAKTRAVREMLEESDVQRSQLEAARGALAEANQRIQLDMDAMKQAELELRQAQKLEAVGRLAAGIAHEINTPIQFVGDSVQFLSSALDDLMKLVERRRKLLGEAPSGAVAPDVLAESRQMDEEADLAFLLENVPGAIERAKEGLARVATIVRSMKEFAHPDDKTMCLVDLNRALLATLTIARNEYKYVADVETDFAELPPVACFPGELNQVVLNLIVNAAHAIADSYARTQERGTIRVTSRREAEQVVVEVSDTGAGIPSDVRERVFEPFFTTKEVGRGTGQGLAIARAVVERHSGSISFRTELDKGTTFTVRIPFAPAPDAFSSGARAA
jgi:signal transduction histidine kinase